MQTAEPPINAGPVIPAGGKDLTQKRNLADWTYPNETQAARRRSASALKDLINLAKPRPEKVWGAFKRWYGRPDCNELPSWVIERIDGEEAHIHIFDFATGAIEPFIRKHCDRKKLDLSKGKARDHPRIEQICISNAGKPLLRLHNTSCSTLEDPNVCVHLEANDDAIITLVELFPDCIYPQDVEFYKNAYTQARPARQSRKPRSASFVVRRK